MERSIPYSVLLTSSDACKGSLASIYTDRPDISKLQSMRELDLLLLTVDLVGEMEIRSYVTKLSPPSHRDFCNGKYNWVNRVV